MKNKSIVAILIFLSVFIISIKNNSNAKYIIQDTKKVASINIEKPQKVDNLSNKDMKEDNFIYNVNYGIYNTKNGWDLDKKDGEIAGYENTDSNYKINSIAYWVSDMLEADFMKIEPIYNKKENNTNNNLKKYVLFNNKKYSIIESTENNFICGIKVNLKNYEKYSVVYQIFNKNGWMNAVSDGQETKNERESLSAFRIKIVEKTQKQEIIKEWNKDVIL